MESSIYIEERNEALKEAYKRIVSAKGVNSMFLNREALLQILIEQPAPKFYISPEWAKRHITAHYKGYPKCLQKRGYGKQNNKMIEDLVEQYEKLMQNNPDAPKKWLYENVVLQPAKSFYVSLRRAKEIIFNYI